jgi:hypothetical protein
MNEAVKFKIVIFMLVIGALKRQKKVESTLETDRNET